MSTRNRPDQIAWLLILSLALIGILMALFAPRVSRGTSVPPPTLIERIEVQARIHSTKREPAVESTQLAVAITNATKSRQWAALLLTIAIHESALSARIAVNDCRKWECDAGRAWGLWQVHRNAHNRATWGSHDLNVQAREASWLAAGFFGTCKKAGVPFPLGVFRAFAGHSCTKPFKGEAERVATFESISRNL